MIKVVDMGLVLGLVFFSSTGYCNEKTLNTNVEEFFRQLNVEAYVVSSDIARRYPFCNASRAAVLPESEMETFFLAGVQDHLTIIRLFAILANYVNSQQIAICGQGDIINHVIEQHGINLGLGLPLQEMAYFAWLPTELAKSTHVADLKIVYRMAYVHRFPKDVYPADIKVGFGEEIEYVGEGKPAKGNLVSFNYHVSAERIGFDNIRGIGVHPQGVLGVLMDIFFFLPDSVSSMFVEHNKLVTRALITQTVDNFETTRRFQMTAPKIGYP